MPEQAAIGTGPYKLVRFTKGDRIILERNDGLLGREAGLAARHLPPHHQRRPARRGAARRRRRPDRERADPGSRAGQVECRVQGGAGPLQPRHLSALRLYRRCAAGRCRRRRQESVPRQARARGDLQGDRSRRDRGAHHGRRCGAGRRIAAADDVRRQQGHEGAQARRRRRPRSCWPKPATRTASRWCSARPTTATSTTPDRAGGGADADAGRASRCRSTP